jgi:hypothetical protein
MTSGEFAPDSSFPAKQLPPRDLWLYDPEKEGRIPTPVDSLGLINPQELIRQAKKTIDPTYDWKSDFSDRHHFYWPNSWYDNQPDARVNPQEFRNEASNQFYGPRLFHNWVHKLMMPSEVLDEEVMYYQNEALRALKALQRSIKGTRELFERKYITDQRLAKGLDYHYNEFFNIKAQISLLPHEFRFIDLSDYEPKSIEEIPAISREIKLAKHVTMATVLPVAARRRAEPSQQVLLAS